MAQLKNYTKEIGRFTILSKKYEINSCQTPLILNNPTDSDSGDIDAGVTIYYKIETYCTAFLPNYPRTTV